MSLALEQLRQTASAHLDNVRTFFKPGVKITLLVRRPGEPEQDFMLTDDDLPEVIAAVERRAEAEAAQYKAQREDVQ